jgi:hypothetical protein
MDRKTYSESQLTGQKLSKTSVQMSKEVAYGTSRRLNTVNVKLRSTSKLVDDMVKARDMEGFAIAHRAWCNTMELWLRLVGYPTPAKLKEGQKPTDAFYGASGGMKYMGEASINMPMILSDDSTPEPDNVD